MGGGVRSRLGRARWRRRCPRTKSTSRARPLRRVRLPERLEGAAAAFYPAKIDEARERGAQGRPRARPRAAPVPRARAGADGLTRAAGDRGSSSTEGDAPARRCALAEAPVASHTSSNGYHGLGANARRGKPARRWSRLANDREVGVREATHDGFFGVAGLGARLRRHAAADEAHEPAARPTRPSPRRSFAAGSTRASTTWTPRTSTRAARRPWARR